MTNWRPEPATCNEPLIISVSFFEVSVCFCSRHQNLIQHKLNKSIRWSGRRSCFLKLGLVLQLYLIWPVRFLPNSSCSFFLNVSDDRLFETKAAPDFSQIRPVCLSLCSNAISATYSAVVTVFQGLTANASGGSHFYNCVCFKITACMPL